MRKLGSVLYYFYTFYPHPDILNILVCPSHLPDCMGSAPL